MPLPARPECTLRIARAIFVDEPVEATVVITTDRPTRIDFIDITVRGRQSWVLSNGKSSSGYSQDVPSLAQRLAGERELPPGEHRFPVRFVLPPGTAPSHDLYPASSRLWIDVHVSIPWWPDGRYGFTVPVRIRPPAHVERVPVLTRHPFNPKGNEPRIELSLASSTLVAGEALVGSVALFHMADDKPRTVRFSFEPLLSLHGYAKPWSRLGSGYESSVTIPAGAAGEAIPFRVAIPTAMTPSFKSLTHDVSWVLSARVGSTFSTKLEIQVPLTIVDEQASAQLAPLTLAPRVADQRVLATFQRLSKQSGMQVVEADQRPDELPALVRDVGASRVRLGYAYRGTDGTFLVGRITYPSVGLGLVVTATSFLSDMVARDIEIDVAAWDRHHRVAARSREQAVPFLRGALPSPGAGNLVRWTDDELVTERAIGALEDAELAAVAASLVSLAHAIENARSLIRPPLDVDEDAWRDLAARWNGTLSFGDLSIEGTLDNERVSVGLAFDGATPTALRMSVGEPDREEREVPTERLSQLLWDVGRELPGVKYDQGVASATLDVAAGIDARRVRDAARALRGLLAALAESSGPYR